MNRFTIDSNRFLSKDVRAFYNCDYIGMKNPGNPTFINALKNDFGKNYVSACGQIFRLDDACQKLDDILSKDLPQIKQELGISDLTVCVIPRSKAERSYPSNKLMMKQIIRNVVNRLGMRDGADYVYRVSDTPTTHYEGADGIYPGITKDTCRLSSEIQGKDILLIDDIYTKTVNIDEDCLQALLDAGARTVAFYSIGKTVRRF